MPDAIQQWLDQLEAWLNHYPYVLVIAQILGVLLLAVVTYYITRRYVLRGIHMLVARSKTKIDDILLQDKFLTRVALIAPVIVIYSFSGMVPGVGGFITRISSILILLIVVFAIGAFLSAAGHVYEEEKLSEGRSIKGFVQTIKLILYLIAIIAAIGILTGESLWTLLGSIGALTAVMLLIFRDTILSFVASIQITSGDLVRVGDWISVPRYGADGTVIDIALHTVQVQNFDKTVVIMPTYKLLDETFKNWRGMQESGGRRIMRSLFIDQSSVRFLDEGLIERLGRIQRISDYVKQKKTELDEFNRDNQVDDAVTANGRRMTNLGTFRAYALQYLQHHPNIRQDMTLLVRQLDPAAEGVPIQIYAFTNTTVWAEYEGIQSDIFDHLIAVMPQFDLRIFQYPTGFDVESLAGRNGETAK
jgi:miniconductance mechanosensitive channel